MSITCGGQVIKIVLFVFNFIWLALGVSILYFGIRVLLKYNTDVANIIKETPSHAAIVLLSAGGVIFVISFLGCYGAIKEHYCMLNAYSVLIFLCIAAQGVGAYFAMRYHFDLEKYAEDGIKSAMDAYDFNQSEDYHTNKAINEFQRNLKCCGAKSYTDWALYGQHPLPSSCCQNATQPAQCTSDKAWSMGCIEAIKNWLTTTIGTLGYIALGVILIQILILISACCLVREIKTYGNYSNPK